METLGVWLGPRLGLYATLARIGAATASAATGTVLRPAGLYNYANQAGFGHVDILPIGDESGAYTAPGCVSNPTLMRLVRTGELVDLREGMDVIGSVYRANPNVS